MSAMPATILRPLAFPSRWHALVCLRTGRVLAFVPPAHAGEAVRDLTPTPHALSA